MQTLYVTKIQAGHGLVYEDATHTRFGYGNVTWSDGWVDDSEARVFDMSDTEQEVFTWYFIYNDLKDIRNGTEFRK